MSELEKEVQGNLKGIRTSVIEDLKTIYELELHDGQLLSQELAVKMARITDFIGREISVYINRSGQILNVIVGDDNTVELPAVEGRRGASRLSGVRCLHTHPGGNPTLSGVDISALKNNRFDCMLAIGVVPEFEKSLVTFGMIAGFDENENYIVECTDVLTLEQAENIHLPNMMAMIERILDKQSASSSLAKVQERASDLLSL